MSITNSNGNVHEYDLVFFSIFPICFSLSPYAARNLNEVLLMFFKNV